MVWKILRPRYWMLDRMVRRNRLLVLALVLLLGLGGQWVYDHLIRDSLALLNSEQAVTAIAASLPLCAFSLLLFALLGVGDVMHQLFLTSDLELLMVAPISSQTVFLVKLLQCSRTTLIPALGLGAFLFAMGQAQGAVTSYYLLIVLSILGATTLTTAMVVTLVVLLARLLPPQRVRAWMPLAVVLTLLVLSLCQGPLTQWFLGQTSMIAFLAEALLDPGKLGLVAAGLGGLALLAVLIASRVFDASFHEGWNRFREVPVGRVSVPLDGRCRWGVSRWLQSLPTPLRCFLIKEWLELSRNPRSIIALAQPLILIVAVVLIPVLGSRGGGEVLRPLLFGFTLMVLTLFLGMLPISTSLMILAEEGRQMAMLRSAPISMSAVLKGKFWASWIPMALSCALVLLGTGIGLQFPLWQIAFLVGITMWGLAGASAATIAIGGLSVDFGAEELKQRIPTVMSYVMMGLNSAFVLLNVVTSLWAIVRLFPGSHGIQAIRQLTGDGTVGWFFLPGMWIPLTLAGGQMLFWAGVKALWDAAVRRLEGWEGN